MRRLLLFLVVFVSSCRIFSSEEFVNPLFNETLKPISRMAWTTQLSPTRVRISNAGYEVIKKCELLENAWEKVSLKCTFFNPLSNRDVTYIYTYQIFPCKGYFCNYAQWKVKEYMANTDGQVNGITWFSISED